VRKFLHYRACQLLFACEKYYGFESIVGCFSELSEIEEGILDLFDTVGCKSFGIVEA